VSDEQDVDVRRDGDTWYFVWPQRQVGFGMDHLKESSDGIHAELTVESVAPGVEGRLAGPVRLNLLSARTQSEIATKLEKRVNGSIGKIDWDTLVTYACAVVAKQYRAPTPIVNLAEVEASAAVDYLIPGLVPEDETTVLYGDGESAKSLLGLRIACSVVSGHQLPWEDEPVRRCPVLYLDWETNPRTVAGRLRRIALGMATNVPEIHYRQCFRSLQDELPHIREEISKRKIGLVIVDSIGFAASGALVEDETARSAMNALRQMSPATRLVVAHVSAEAARQTTGAARPFGSAFFWNGMRSGLELRRAEEGADADNIELGLYHRKANDGEHHKPIGISVLFDGRQGAIGFWKADIRDMPDLAARTTLSSRLRDLLRDGQRDTIDLSEELDIPIDTVSKTLRRMPDVVRLSDGGGRGKPATWGLQEEAF
jgi:hypothetical protein